MAAQWPVFVTAMRPSSKALNRAFLLIQDFEFTGGKQDSSWTLLSSAKLPSTKPPVTIFPVPDMSDNEFASMSLDALTELGMTTGNWLIIDQKGLETSTCIVCEQYYDDEEDIPDDKRLTDEFQACRLPYEEAWGVYANLDIANMGWEDFVDVDAGVQEDGTWKWISFAPSENEAAEHIMKEADVKRERR
ncbi:hypothetical protein B0H10DRAFT_2026566 [Mycena sp. CBHHK59/15]|nr:hypothetical protein B0H10DRAFT_2026566 [Mycena sp. CBHHK59/15]